jgi:NADH dehydrogenase FAD-containing subunit
VASPAATWPEESGAPGATVVNPTNFMLYTPLLPEAAAGTIEPRHVLVPIRGMAPHADLLLGAVTELDHEHRRVIVQSDAGRFGVTYSDLVIALGSVTRMPDVPGLSEHALGLKNVSDAIRLAQPRAAPDRARRRRRRRPPRAASRSCSPAPASPVSRRSPSSTS